MKYLDEYRDGEAVQRVARQLSKIVTRPWTIMEVCGGQTHSIVKFGVDELLPDKITLVHGPGCPVCVTPLELIDKAIEIASRPNLIFCSFGDMLRVPGSSTDLLSVKARGGDVRIVYSPLDAVKIARENPDREVVFFAVGFETTAPANAMAVHQAKLAAVANFSILVSQVLVPPAMEAILSSPHNRVNGFLAAGHVCTVMEVWKNREHVILFDASVSGAALGTITRVDATASGPPTSFSLASSHAFSALEAVELARRLGQLPLSLIIYAIEGRDFGFGTDLSPEVSAAVNKVVSRVCREVASLSERSGWKKV